MRYFDITTFKVKPGHDKEWEELVKLYKDGYTKVAPDSVWATYESQYGADNGGIFLVMIPMKSLSEVDKGFGDGKKFMDAIGDSGQKRLRELTAACLASVQDNLFRVNPKMSYPPQHFLDYDPGFWKPKTAVVAKPAPSKPE